jgi:hypothetical protein
VLFAGGFVETLSWLASTRLKAVLVSAFLLLVALTAIDMARLHPYEYTYFNRTVGGGIVTASARYDTEYLGLAYREGVRWVVDHYQPAHEGPVRISACRGYFANLRDALDHAGAGAARYKPVRHNQPAEIAVAATLLECHSRYPGKRLATIGREAVPFLHIIQLR